MGKSEKKMGKLKNHPTHRLSCQHQIQVALEEASPHRAAGTGTPGRHRRPRAAGGRFGGHVVGDTDDAIGVCGVCGLLGSWRNVKVQSTSWKMVRIFELDGLRFQSTDLNSQLLLVKSAFLLAEIQVLLLVNFTYTHLNQQ